MKKHTNKYLGFTLVELLVVIAVIALLAAMLMPVYNMVGKHAAIQRAQSERDQLETVIDSYKAKYGFYPPSSGLGLPSTNQLYYELLGTSMTNSGVGTNFTTSDNSSTVASSLVASTFGVGGFMNCSQGSGEDSHNAQDFFPGLKIGQIATNGSGVFVIVTAVPSDSIYQPMPGFHTVSGTANPWCYLFPGTNNPNSYDLSLEIMIGGKTNLICNWVKNVQIQ